MKTFCLLCAIALVITGLWWLAYLAVDVQHAPSGDISPGVFAPALAIVFFGLAFFVLGEIYRRIAEIAANTRKQG